MRRVVAAMALVVCLGCETKKAPEPEDLRRPGKVCELHGVPLQEDTFGIRYGLPDKDYLRARAELFPNAETEVLGGCVEKDRKSAQVSFCPECRSARLEWCKSRK
jgi:hypothetical protein